MTQRLQIANSAVIIRVLDIDNVRAELVVQTGLRQRLGRRQVPVEHVVQVLDGGGNNTTAARRADHKVQLAVGLLDDDGGNGGQGPLAGADVVGRAGDVAEGVAGAGDAEVVHLVVHDDARLGDHELRPEEEVDGRRERDGEAAGVGGGHVRGPRRLEGLEALGVVRGHVLGAEVGDLGAHLGAGLGGDHGGRVGGHAVDEERVAKLGALAVGEADGLVEAVDGEVAARGGAEVLVAGDGVERAEGDDAAGGGVAGGELVAAVGDVCGLADGDGVVCEVGEGHGAVGGAEGGDGGVGDGAGVEGVGAAVGDGLEGVGVALAGHGLVEADAVAVGGEVHGPGGVVGEEVAVGGDGVHVLDEVLVDAEAEAGDLDGGRDEVGPGEAAVLVVQVLQAAELTRDTTVCC